MRQYRDVQLDTGKEVEEIVETVEEAVSEVEAVEE